jgi:hypothetical protein
MVVLTEGSKSLAALGGGTPAGASGVRLKVVGKVKPGPAKLRISFSPVGASDVSRTVKIRFR